MWPPHFLMKFGNSSYSVTYRKICRDFGARDVHHYDLTTLKSARAKTSSTEGRTTVAEGPSEPEPQRGRVWATAPLPDFNPITIRGADHSPLIFQDR